MVRLFLKVLQIFFGILTDSIYLSFTSKLYYIEKPICWLNHYSEHINELKE